MGFYISKKIGFISLDSCSIFEVLAGISCQFWHINGHYSFLQEYCFPFSKIVSPQNCLFLYTSLNPLNSSSMLKLKILPYPFEANKIVGGIRAKSNLFLLTLNPLWKQNINSFTLNPPWEENTDLFPVPSCKGKIKTLLFILPKDDKAKSRFNLFPVLKEVINKMSTVEEFIIIHRGQELDLDLRFKQWLCKHDRVTLKTIRDEDGKPAKDAELSIWAQDHFYPVQFLPPTSSSTPICYGLVGNIPDNFTPALEAVIHSSIENNIIPNFKLEETQLPFEGGNILVGDGFMLVGANDYSFGKEVYENWFGVPTIFVGTNIPPPTKKEHLSIDCFTNQFPIVSTLPNQPLFHIDMFLTLAGFNAQKTAYTIVVGQPRLGVEQIKDIDLEFYLVLNNWITTIQASIRSCVENLKNSFKEQLKVHLNIVPIPLVLTYNDKISSDTRKREWFWASYNNCLVEKIEDTTTPKTSKKVWLPSYGSDASKYHKKEAISEETLAIIQSNLDTRKAIQYGDWSYLEKYDQESKNTWEALGFEVFLLEENYLPFARQHGSLNCLTNCLKR